jgi:P27 family predicted phage terminase small subunit
VAAGRKPIPTALKRLRGNPGKRALNREEPAADPELPEMPADLAEISPVAREEWERVGTALKDLRVISTLDRALLAVYCQDWETWIAATKNVQRYGAVIRSPSGFLTQNPYVAIANRAADRLLKTCAALGLSPSERSRMRTPGPNEESDEFSEFELIQGGKRG